MAADGDGHRGEHVGGHERDVNVELVGRLDGVFPALPTAGTRRGTGRPREGVEVEVVPAVVGVGERDRLRFRPPPPGLLRRLPLLLAGLGDQCGQKLVLLQGVLLLPQPVPVEEGRPLPDPVLEGVPDRPADVIRPLPPLPVPRYRRFLNIARCRRGRRPGRSSTTVRDQRGVGLGLAAESAPVPPGPPAATTRPRRRAPRSPRRTRRRGRPPAPCRGTP